MVLGPGTVFVYFMFLRKIKAIYFCVQTENNFFKWANPGLFLFIFTLFIITYNFNNTN